MADWSALPGIAVVLISRRLQLIEDFIAFRSTCSSWREATTLKDFYTSSSSSSSCPKLPLLMLEHYEREGPEANHEGKFLSLSKGKTSNISFPEANNMLCRGSKGWLIMVERSTKSVCLLNPITRFQIPLPKDPIQINFEGFTIRLKDFIRAVLSASPSETSDYVVMVVFSVTITSCISPDCYDQLLHYTGFWKPGNLTWTEVKIKFVEDLNYYNGRFYALTELAEVWMCDVSGPNPKASKIVKLPWMLLRPYAQLVECGGRLLMVAPFHQKLLDGQCKGYLEMVELDVIKGSYNIITSLGSSTVFLGRNEGFSIDASRFPGIIKPNLIYFSDGSYQVATRGSKSTKNYGYGVWFNF